jgi:hypothetical protein
MNETKAVAVFMANFKKKVKPSNLLEFAEACRTLLEHKHWGIDEMKRYFGASEYMIRQIDKINELKNSKIKKLIKEGKLGIDACYQLSRIKEPKRTRIAGIIKDLPQNEQRRLVYFIANDPNLSITEAKNLVEKEKPEEIKLLVIPLDNHTYENLARTARRTKLKIHDYALKILKEKVEGNND